MFSDAEHVAIRESPRVWFDSFGFLEDREKKLRKADPTNRIQAQLFDIYEWCQANGVPCNIIGLKSRKEGLSTGASALAYHHLREHRSEAVVIGTDNETSDTLVDMIVRYAQNDQYDWRSSFQYTPSQHRGVFSHGSEFKRDTAIDPKAGRSSTVQVLVATEVAHWPASGVRSADETMLSILNSMPDIANLLRIVDSTANGASGFFYDTYTEAVTFEERKAGKVGNGWIRVFEPWWTSEIRTVVLTDDQRAAVRVHLSDREKAGMARYGWSEGKVMWRRQTIASKCGGDESKFDQEYPENEDVAFLTSGSPCFNVAQVGRMLAKAEAAWALTKAGVLTAPRIGHLTGNLVFMGVKEDAWLWVNEGPTRGRDYLLFCDPMTGEQSKGAKVRDRHACGIIRAAYIDDDGLIHDAEVVAVLYAENGVCQWAMDILATRIRLLHRWYGECMIVPEVNKAMDLIPLLRAAGATNIYHRPVRPDAANPSEKQNTVGFLTTPSTRNLWVNALDEAIREQTFECLYLPAIKDFASMIVNEDGRKEAAPKKHDDWCTGIGIGLLTINAATRYPLLTNRVHSANQSRQLSGATNHPTFGSCG